MNYKMGGLNKLLKNNLFKCLIELLFEIINESNCPQLFRSFRRGFMSNFEDVKRLTQFQSCRAILPQLKSL